MADNLRKYTTQEVLNKVYTDSSGNAIGINSSTTKETLNAVFSTSDNSLNVALSGGTISGNVTIEGDLTVNGSATNSYDEIVNGDLHVKSDAGNSTSAFLVEQNDGTDVFVVDTTNSRANVGARVGTAILEVKGSVDNDYAGRFENTDSGGYGALVKIAGTTADDLAFQVRADSTNILTINGDSSSTFGGNVGIGSDSPISILEIKGTNSSLDGVSAGLVVHDSGSVNAGLQLINNSGKFALHADGANDRVDFYLDDATTGSSFAGGDKILTLKYGGNVGISQDNPQSKLHINVGTDQNLEVTSVSSKLHLMGTNDARSANIPLTLGFTEYDFEGATGSTIRLKSTNSNITAPELVGKLEAYISDASGNLPGVAGSIDWTTNDSIDGGLTKGTNFTLKTYLESSGLVTAMTALANGNIGIGSTPKTHLDVQSYQADGITIGADNDTNRTRTDNTIKTGGITGVHYANAEESIRLIGYASSSSDNTLLLGGGNGDWNSATAINFYVGANTTTTSGDLRFKLDTNSRISLSNNDSGGTGGADGTSGNTLFGAYTGLNITTGGEDNAFFGHASGNKNTDGEKNTGFGTFAGFGNRTGDFNTYVGYGAGFGVDNNNHSNNTGVGYQSLKAIEEGGDNVAIGANSLLVETDGDKSTAIGSEALKAQTGTTGTAGNTAVGFQAGSNITTGIEATIVGAFSTISAVNGQNQTVLGSGVTGQGNNSVTLGNASVTDVYMAQDSGATVHARHMNLIDSADNSSAGFLNLKNDRANPADNDETGRIYMYADDDGGNPTEAILMIGRLTDVSNGNEDSDLRMYTMLNGTQKETLTLSSGVVNLPQGQLKFPATQVASADANTLDDYEEGTWTATDGSGAGLSLTLEENTYVKIGRLVTAHMIVTFPTTSDTNLATLTLPFNAESISSSAGGAVLEQNVNTANMYTACVNGTNACIFRLNGGTAQTNANVSGKKLRFVITYMS